MGQQTKFKDKLKKFSSTFKLDKHHAIERFGVFFGIFAVIGTLVLTTTGASAFKAGRDQLSQTALYTTSFKASKTNLQGTVDGVFRNSTGNRVLVMMHFASSAAISYRAEDYQAFLLGSDTSLNTDVVTTPGVKGSFYVFGSTGYVGVVLEASRTFDKQIVNLTMRSNAELSFNQNGTPSSTSPNANGDSSFEKYDQWSVYLNPGAEQVKPIKALDALTFDPAGAYYDIVIKSQEAEARTALENKLAQMRTDLAQIQSYSTDLSTTKVDGLFLRPPTVPITIADDQITGESASQTGDESTLTLETKHVVPGGFNFDWRSGNVYDGYATQVLPAGQTYAQMLAAKAKEGDDTTLQQLSGMQWILSDGSNLVSDYKSSDVSMRPLMNVMNRLSQAYLNYAKNKNNYQTGLSLDLLKLDVELRDVQTNSSTNITSGFLTVLY